MLYQQKVNNRFESPVFMQRGSEFAAGVVSTPLIHFCCWTHPLSAQHERLHLISYKWKHKLLPVWLSNCEVFIFVDQTAKFVCEAVVSQMLLIKAELQKRTRSERNETDTSSPSVHQMTWILRKEKKSLFTIGSIKMWITPITFSSSK